MLELKASKLKLNFALPKNLEGILGKSSYIPFILILLGLISAGVAYSQYGHLGTLQAQNDQETSRLEDLKKKLSRLRELSNQRQIIEEDYEIFFNATPDSTFVPTYLGQIEAIAKEAGVEIVTLTYAGAAGATQGGQSVVDARVSVKAGFSTMEAFLAKLEESLRLTEVTDFRYSIDQEGNTSVDLTLRARYTSSSQSAVETPLTFDVTDPEFIKTADKLKSFSRYPIEIPEE